MKVQALLYPLGEESKHRISMMNSSFFSAFTVFSNRDEQWITPSEFWTLKFTNISIDDTSGLYTSDIEFLFSESAPNHWLIQGQEFFVLDGQKILFRGIIK